MGTTPHSGRESGVNSLTATLPDGCGGYAEGEVLRLERTRARVAFARDGSPQLPLARSVVLSFCDRPHERCLDVPAHLVGHREGHSVSIYEFRLPAARGEELTSVYKTRRYDRVSPAEDDPPIEVNLVDEFTGEAVRASLRDISPLGIGVFVPSVEEERVFRARRLRLAFYLPGFASPFRFSGEVKHRTVLGSALVYGIAFDTFDDPETRRQMELIASYCRERIGTTRPADRKPPGRRSS